MGNRDSALVNFQHALAIWEKLVAENPTVTSYQSGLATNDNNLGILRLETGDREAALEIFQHSLAIREKLATDHPDVVGYQVDLGSACCNLGNLISSGGDFEEALVWFARAAQTLQRVVDRDDRLTTARAFLGNTHWGRASALGKLSRYSEAAEDWQRAAELNDGREQTALQRSRVDALARAGDHVRAAAEAGDLAAIEALPANTVYNLACVLSLCAAAVKDDTALADRYGARALELLARARALGFFNAAANVEHLATDADLNALRERDDFRKFVEGLPKSPPNQE
jgi:tetratricopeptide (TPR) repeat protein